MNEANSVRVGLSGPGFVNITSELLVHEWLPHFLRPVKVVQIAGLTSQSTCRNTGISHSAVYMTNVVATLWWTQNAPAAFGLFQLLQGKHATP